MKKFSESLREHAKWITDFENKKMLSLTHRELKSYENAKVCCTCGKYFIKEIFWDINYRKVRHHCCYTGKYRGTAHTICSLKFIRWFLFVIYWWKQWKT